MLRSAFAFLFCLTAISQLPSTAIALVGEVDKDDKFPYVVQLQIEFSDGSASLCSGAVSRASMVSTAAHCIWDTKLGLATKVTISYTDADGRQRQVNHKRLYHPTAFETTYAKWQQERPSVSPEQNTKNFMRMTLEDIAFVVPEEFIEVEGFPHWGTELLVGEECFISTDELVKYGDTMPERCARTFKPQIIGENFGDLAKVRALAVGYGYNKCDDYFSRKNCVSDGLRRFAEIPLMPTVQVASETFAVPDIWCTGVGDQGFSPVQHGDSGGPRFVRAKDGRWIFVGFTSGGHAGRNCSSSIFRHLDLWRRAAVDMENMKSEMRSDPSVNWEKHQFKRLLVEILASWSLPPEEAVARLNSLYQGDMSINSADLSRDAAIKMKTEFIRKWPARRFELDQSVETTFVASSDGDPVGTISARVNWQLDNAANGGKAAGASDFDFTIWYHRESEQKVAYGQMLTPQLNVEKCYHVHGSQDILGCDQPKKRSLWDHNGSVMTMEVVGDKVSILYKKPSPRMAGLVEEGWTLFEGKRSGNAISGYSTIFNDSCTQETYDVAGSMSDDGHTITLFGEAPRIGDDCSVVGSRKDKLVFTHIEG